MSGKDTITERLAQIVPTCMDGELWYEAQRVYQAFRLDPRKAAREIRKEYKRREFRYVRGWRSYNTYYLHRKGVETLAILYGQQPRAEIMAALLTDYEMPSASEEFK